MGTSATGPAGLPLRDTGRKCTVCSHPDRERIDAAIVAGVDSFNALASRFELDDSAIQRHSVTHLPVRLVRNAEALQAQSDKEFVKLAVTLASNRLARLQARRDQLEEIRQARASAAEAGVPGDHTGLIVKRRRAVRIDKSTWAQVTDSEIDTGLLAEERAIELAVARETGEWLAQTGRGSFGAGGAGGVGPLVVVLASGLHPLPGSAPQEARHRIQDARRARQMTAAEAEGVDQVPLSMIDIEVGEDTRQEAMSGVDVDVPGPGVAVDEDEDDALS
jgi:hypothetical protein